ncbi:MAG: hypothetical protein Phog2KO_32960 [Phototrophicaceae bacterium]
MRFLRLFISLSVCLIFVLPTMAQVGISVDSVSSDCSTVTVTYTLSNAAPPDDIVMFVDIVSPMQIRVNADAQDVNGTFTQVVDIPDQEDGASIVVEIKDTVSMTTGTSNTISCDSSTDASEPPQLLINDGRVEPFSSDRAIFPETDGIKIYTPEGELVLFIPVESIELIGTPENGANLLGETADSYVRVYILSDGRYMALVGPDFEGKTHVTFWNGLGVANDVTTTTFTS